MAKIKNYKDVWESPLYNDEFGNVWSTDDIRAFDFDKVNVSMATQSRMMACLNDEFEPACITSGTLEYRDEGEIFHIDPAGKELKYIDLRGWGHMTGTLKLTSKRAAELQDQFAAFIIDRLAGSRE